MKVNLSQDEFIRRFKEGRKQVKDPVVLDYKNHVLVINEQGDPRTLFFYLPEKKRIDKAKLEFSAIFSALNKLAKHIVYEDNSLLKVINKDGIDIEGLKRRNAETLLGYARIDTVFGDDEYRVLEFNSRRPQMYEDADFYSEYVSRAIGGENVINEETGYDIVEAIQAHFEINTRKRIPENIVVLNNFPNHRYPYSSLTRINAFFDQSNIFLFDCKTVGDFYQNIELTDSGIIYEGAKIDLLILQSICGKNSLYNKNGSIRIKKIAEAYNKGLVELFTQPSTQISGTKLSLDLIQDPEIQEKLKLDLDELNAIDTIPKSIHSEKAADIFSYKKDDYVIKLTGVGQGSGVKLGVELSQAEWDAQLRKLVDSKVKFLLQERVVFEEAKILNENTCKFEKAYVTLEPFVVNNPLKLTRPFVSGYSTRAIPADKFAKDLKFNPAYDRPEVYFGALIETE